MHTGTPIRLAHAVTVTNADRRPAHRSMHGYESVNSIISMWFISCRARVMNEELFWLFGLMPIVVLLSYAITFVVLQTNFTSNSRQSTAHQLLGSVPCIHT
mmetsp:Transcript_37767/g.61201  ORF Transcript_37767/g.61201 Transcript_37767/m.61201 type:complete len:101 (+) Transcript_37767:1860-2162(+)